MKLYSPTTQLKPFFNHERRRIQMKRSLNIMAVLIVAILVLTSCANPAKTQAPVAPATAAATEAPVVPAVTEAPASTQGGAPAASVAAPSLTIYMQMGGT